MYDYMKALQKRFDHQEHSELDKQVEYAQEELRRDMDAVGRKKLLRLLVEHRGQALTRAALVDRIWTDGAEYVDENALSVTVKRLRDKLEDMPSKPRYIKTVYGLGYTWAVN